MTASKTKLYLVVRQDLPPGLQAAQLVHAAIELCLEHPEEVRAWRDASQNLACLAAPDRSKLTELAEATSRERSVSAFEEPDLGGELTAIAVLGERLFPSLPLALRPQRDAVAP